MESNKQELLENYVHNNIGEIYKNFTKDGKIGYICGYYSDTDLFIIIGFVDYIGLNNTNAFPSGIYLKEYKSYWNVSAKFE